jgi:hemolysin III
MTASLTNDPKWHARHLARAARLHQEERINTITHGIGCAISVVAVGYLFTVVIEHGSWPQIVACVVYGVALVAVYLASALSHAFYDSRWRRLFRMIDQACIFLLIAGTFTPPAVTYLSAAYWWWLFVVMWGIALVGFTLKAFFAHRVDAVTARLHLMMGWIPIVSLKPMVTAAPAGLLWWMLAGGVCYTAGTIFLHRDQHYPYFHAVWHLLVVAGSACHFVAILLYCTTAVA